MAELVLPSGAIKVIQTQQNMVGSAITGGAGAVTNNISETDNTGVVGVLEQIKEVSLRSFKGITRVATLLADTLSFEKANARRERDQAAELEKERKSKLGTVAAVGGSGSGLKDEDEGGFDIGAGGGFLAGMGLAPLMKSAKNILKKIIAPFSRLLTSLGRLTGLAGLFGRLGPLLGPLGPVGAIAGALFLIVQYSDELAKVFSPIIDGLKKTFEILKPVISPIFELADFLIKLTLGELATALTAAFRMINNSLSFLVDNFLGLNQMLLGIVTGDFDLIKKGFNKIKNAFSTLGDKILNAIIGAVNGLIDALPFVPQKIKDKMKFDKVGAEAPQEETKPETKTPDSKKSLFTSDKAYKSDTIEKDEVVETPVLPKTKNVDEVMSVADTAEKVMKAEPAVYTTEQREKDIESLEAFLSGSYSKRKNNLLSDLEASGVSGPISRTGVDSVSGVDFDKKNAELLEKAKAAGMGFEFEQALEMSLRLRKANLAKSDLQMGMPDRPEIMKQFDDATGIKPRVKTTGETLVAKGNQGNVTIVNNQPQNINSSTNVAKTSVSQGSINTSSGDNYFDRQAYNAIV